MDPTRAFTVQVVVRCCAKYVARLSLNTTMACQFRPISRRKRTLARVPSRWYCSTRGRRDFQNASRIK